MEMLDAHLYCDTCKDKKILCLVDFMMDNEWGHDVVTHATKLYGEKLNLEF